MWARVIETMLGCWLALSPFIFRHPVEARGWWLNDLTCAFIVVTLALLSLWPPLRHAHLGLIVVALWLMGFGYFAAPHSLPPALQNDLLTGLVLLMLAIIPNEALQPPAAWREFSATQTNPSANRYQ